MANPKDLKYTRDHMWVRAQAGEATIGITEYAAKQLGDVVMVEIFIPRDTLDKDDAFGTVESVKAVSELFAPVGGTLVARNEAINDEPELLNTDPYGDGWIIRVKMSDAKELDDHMTSAQYDAFLKNEESD